MVKRESCLQATFVLYALLGRRCHESRALGAMMLEVLKLRRLRRSSSVTSARSAPASDFGMSSAIIADSPIAHRRSHHAVALPPPSLRSQTPPHIYTMFQLSEESKARHALPQLPQHPQHY